MSDIQSYATWNNDSEKQKAYDSSVDAISSYEGIQKAQAYSYRSYIDIEPNKTVRTSITRNDYYRFRPEEAVPLRQKRILKMCMDAYDRTGIIRNVIDLMGDFASQGITIIHPNKSIERFYRRWFKEVNGIERSERFLNYLYRCGNVIVKKRTAKINYSKEQELRKAIGDVDMEIPSTKVARREIPWGYDFLNPLTVDILNYYNGMFIGDPIYILNLSKTTYDSFSASDVTGRTSFSKLPPDIQAQIKNGKRYLKLDPEKIAVHHYKKDDWLVWANPMVYAILDDLIMLEKMKLADVAALDGAISSIRLWRIGSLDHKIIPRKEVIDKLRNILAANTGGGTMDLIWGPELDFKESDSQIYKFLGNEKYQPVLTSIYAGLGIPPTLAGASNSGGYTNNYISLKTLVERLEYGRQILTNFWNKELETIQKAMGFRFPAQIRFDNIILSDEATINNLMIQLADRSIISNETVLERLGENPDIEKIRVRREERDRRNDSLIPRKASPYHSPNIREDVTKILATKDMLTDDFYDEYEIEKQNAPASPAPKFGGGNPIQDKKVTDKQNGRPAGIGDSQKRKQKVVQPRTATPSTATIWAYNAQKTIAEIVTPMILDFYKKSNVRQLTKGEFSELEHLKLCLLTGIEPFMDINPEVISRLIQDSYRPKEEFYSKVDNEIQNFVYANSRKPTIDELKLIYASVYVDLSEIE